MDKSASVQEPIWTVSGIVWMLMFVQFATGALLAFYYAPTIDHAHPSVSFIEKVLASGSWLRALHHHGSQWLPVFLFIYVMELFWRRAYSLRRPRWLTAVVLLALVFAAAATGYSLPWDAQAFFSTRVAQGIATGLPLVGSIARRWLLGGDKISTLTLSRFFALHVLITPFLILAVVGWKILRTATGAEESLWQRFAQRRVAANVGLAFIAFLALAFYAKKFPAPLGPAAADAGPNYLPRPGAQFRWLYESLKHLPVAVGSLLAVVVPLLFFVALLALPWFAKPGLAKDRARVVGGVLLSMAFLFVMSMTILSYANDRRDPRTRDQLAKQAAAEAAFRNEPFTPEPLASDATVSRRPASALTNVVPQPFTKLCANCHGEHGEGARQGPLKFPPLLGVGQKPKRSVDDIVRLLDDPKAYGLEPPMKSFAGKLTDEEKRQIAEWIVTLKR